MARPVGVICATESEIAPFVERMEDVSVTDKALFSFHSGRLGGVEVVVVCCGICKTNSAMVTQMLIDCFDVRAIVNAGTGGGIDPQVGLFDIVVTAQAEHHDVDAQTMLVESFPFFPSGIFQADEALVAAAQRAAQGCEATVRFGKAVSGEQFITDEQRDAIVAARGPLTVDMEGASIAQVCFANAIPFIGVRCVTDTAAHDGYGSYELNRDRASAAACAFTEQLLASYEA